MSIKSLSHLSTTEQAGPLLPSTIGCLAAHRQTPIQSAPKTFTENHFLDTGHLNNTRTTLAAWLWLLGATNGNRSLYQHK